MGYTKLSSELVLSTVWREQAHVLLVCITMLSIKDQHHEVLASVPGLADVARVSLAECQDALRVLSSPDEHSRSKAEGGRRIKEIPGGWFVVNGEAHRRRNSPDEARAKKAEYMRKYRSSVTSVTATVTARNQCNTNRTVTNQEHTDPPTPIGVVPPASRDRDISQGDLDSFSPDMGSSREASEGTQQALEIVLAHGTTIESFSKPKRASEASRPKATSWRRFPPDFVPDETHRVLAQRLGLNLAEELAAILDHLYQKPMVDAAAALRTWLRNSAKWAPKRLDFGARQPKQPNGGTWQPRIAAKGEF